MVLARFQGDVFAVQSRGHLPVCNLKETGITVTRGKAEQGVAFAFFNHQIIVITLVIVFAIYPVTLIIIRTTSNGLSFI